MIYMKDENFIKAEREDFKTDLIDNNLSVKSNWNNIRNK